MPLGESELQQIGDYVRGNLSDWLLDASPQVVTGRDLLQSQVRLQQELKHLRETMETRFTAQQELMEARFAAVDQRFAAQQELMEARFAAVDRRFEAVDQRFESVQETMKAGFAAVDQRFVRGRREAVLDGEVDGLGCLRRAGNPRFGAGTHRRRVSDVIGAHLADRTPAPGGGARGGCGGGATLTRAGRA